MLIRWLIVYLVERATASDLASWDLHGPAYMASIFEEPPA